MTQEQLHQLYIVEHKNTYQIAKILECNASTVSYNLKKYNIPIRSKADRQSKYTKNNNYFSIPIVENCYWAGFIAADGCINNTTLSISLQSLDRIILECFLKQTECTNLISDLIRTRTNPRFKKPEYFESKVQIRANYWDKDLLKHWNITPCKSLTLKPPNITNLNLCLSYIVGYIDGDGSISYNKKFNLSVDGNYELLNWISSTLYKIENQEKYNPLKIYKTSGKSFFIQCNTHRAYNILKVLTNIQTPYRLARKWDKVKLFEESLKN